MEVNGFFFTRVSNVAKGLDKSRIIECKVTSKI